MGERSIEDLQAALLATASRALDELNRRDLALLPAVELVEVLRVTGDLAARLPEPDDAEDDFCGELLDALLLLRAAYRHGWYDDEWTLEQREQTAEMLDRYADALASADADMAKMQEPSSPAN